VAPNKYLAKIASDLDKPDGLTIVPVDCEGIISFLAPLPVGRVWGVGRVTQARLEEKGIRTIGDLQKASVKTLAGLMGDRHAEHLRALAHGEDTRNIELGREEKSISREYTFSEDSTDIKLIEKVLLDLVDDVGSQLRESGKYAAVAHLKLRWKGFRTITRQKPFLRTCCDDFTLRETALDIFRAQELNKPVRLIGFGVSRFRDSGDSDEMQLDLFESDNTDRSKKEKLSRTVDELCSKLGKKAIRRASSAGRGRLA
jgi:DNA polymerase-4